MKKRLLLVTNGFPYGESERGFLDEEVKILAKEFDLFILALDDQEPLLYPLEGAKRLDQYQIPSFRKSLGVSLLKELLAYSTLRELWDCWKHHNFHNISKILTEILYFRFKMWVAKQKIRQLVQAEGIDLVYTYWATGPAVASCMLKKEFPGLKVVTRFHGMDLYQERTPINWQPFRREIVNHADGLYFACEYGYQYFLEHWGEPCKEKMSIHYLGSTDRIAIDVVKKQPLQIISCSNLIPLKRVELIIEGLACLPDDMLVAWDIFGDGPLRAELESLAREKLGNHSNITWKFHGFVSNDMLADAYRKLEPQVFMTTSSTEGGAPVSIQEIFSMAIPAIGTTVGGIPDLIVDGETGFLMPQNVTPDDVAKAIMRYADLSEEQVQRMSAAARMRWAEKFDAVKNAEHFVEYLRNLA